MHHPHHAVIDLELAALARWCNGDPDGYLEISAPDVVYFDPFIGQRIDGLPALTAYYTGLRGKIYAKHYKMSSAHLQEHGELLILSFHFASWNDDAARAMRWHCSEAYRHGPDGWRIVHTHWSLSGNTTN